MNKRSRLIGVLVVVLLLLMGSWWFWASKKVPTPEIAAKSVGGSVVSSKSVPSSLSPENYPNGLPPKKDFVDPKVAKIEGIWAGQNAQAQDFYGKAIDQHGEPVAGATVTGTLMQIRGVDAGTKKDFYTRQTDNDGNFEFTGLHGWQLGVVVKKVGYQMGQGTGFYQAPNKEDKTNGTERAIFHMWKLIGAEPMKAYSISTAIPCDGTPTSYNLLTGQKIAAGGDLVVMLTRTPVNIDRSKPFDWSVTLEISGGGLMDINDLYPNEAPADGYQPSVTIEMSPVTKNWQTALTHSFYFKSGGNYGRIAINIQADFQPPPTYFGADVHINPSGSRNLEFDQAKQVH